MERDFQVFISYTRDDQEIAENVYQSLEKKGFSPWLDKKKIKGGQNWDFELRRALNQSSIILLLWSASSKDHRGYIQREIKLALNKLEEKLVDDIFIVPVIIGEGLEIPEQISSIHCLHWSDPQILTQIFDSIEHQIEKLGGKIEKQQESQEIFWKPLEMREEWDGLPGYRINISSFELSSPKYKDISDIHKFVNAQFLASFFSCRQQKFSQNPETYNFTQDEWSRTNTFDVFCAEPRISGTVLSLLYTKSWYFAGAAHPTHAHETFNYVVEPCTQIERLSDLFDEPDKVFSTIQALVRRSLMESDSIRFGDLETELAPSTIRWIEEGTASWDDLNSFIVTEEGIEIFFNSYQVACYAAGLPHAVISYKTIRDDIKKHLRAALNIEYKVFDQET